MIKHELIIKLRRTTFYDVLSEILDYFRLNKENYELDYTRLLIRWFYVTFRKTLNHIINIFNKRVDPCGVYPTLLYSDYLDLHLPKRDVKSKNH